VQHIAILRVVTQGVVAFGHLPMDVCDRWLSRSARELALRSRTGADNAHVGEFATQLLVDLGYETLLAPDGQAALELISRGEHVDVMFTDVVMPGMSGIDLAKEFGRRRPGVPVVLASGYSHIVTEEGTHGFPLLRKPYSMDGLSNAMRLALSA